MPAIFISQKVQRTKYQTMDYLPRHNSTTQPSRPFHPRPILPAAQHTSPIQSNTKPNILYLSWPTPPPTHHRIQKRQKPNKKHQATAVFAARDVQEYAADGIGVMELLLQEWHRSLARDIKYFRSFSVYGQVKLQEARNATHFLSQGGPNNTVTCTAWELLTQLFSTIPAPAGPALLSVLAHLVHPLFSNVTHVLQHIADVAQAADEAPQKTTSMSSSSFDAGAVTYQELNTRLLNKIKRLTAHSKSLNGQRQASAKESAKRQLQFNGTISIWQKSLKSFYLVAWRKHIVLQKTCSKKLLKVLFPDQKGATAANPVFAQRLVFCGWRSAVCVSITKRLGPMCEGWNNKCNKLQRQVQKELFQSQKLKKELKDLKKALTASKNLVDNRKRQIELISNKFNRLSTKMLPVKATLEIFNFIHLKKI